jgi:hypothetical protein
VGSAATAERTSVGTPRSAAGPPGQAANECDTSGLDVQEPHRSSVVRSVIEIVHPASSDTETNIRPGGDQANGTRLASTA